MSRRNMRTTLTTGPSTKSTRSVITIRPLFHTSTPLLIQLLAELQAPTVFTRRVFPQKRVAIPNTRRKGYLNLPDRRSLPSSKRDRQFPPASIAGVTTPDQTRTPSEPIHAPF